MAISFVTDTAVIWKRFDPVINGKIVEVHKNDTYDIGIMAADGSLQTAPQVQKDLIKAATPRKKPLQKGTKVEYHFGNPQIEWTRMVEEEYSFNDIRKLAQGMLSDS